MRSRHAMACFTLKKNERILKHSDFSVVYQKGEQLKTKHFKISLLRNTDGQIRLGVTVSKKCGNAVERNSIKRYLREYFRLNKELLPQKYDIVLTAGKRAYLLSFNNIKQELDSVFAHYKAVPKTLD